MDERDDVRLWFYRYMGEAREAKDGKKGWLAIKTANGRIIISRYEIHFFRDLLHSSLHLTFGNWYCILLKDIGYSTVDQPRNKLQLFSCTFLNCSFFSVLQQQLSAHSSVIFKAKIPEIIKKTIRNIAIYFCKKIFFSPIRHAHLLEQQHSLSLSRIRIYEIALARWKSWFICLCAIVSP